MKAVSWESVFFYLLFSVFVYYQQLHARDFRGTSQHLPILLNFSALVGTVTGLVYLIFYGWTVVWWVPVMMLFISIIFVALAGSVLEMLVGRLVLSLLGFLGWPVCAYLMFQSIPP